MLKNNMIRIICLTALFLMVEHSVNAQETSATFSNHVIIGNDANACVAGIEGAMRYSGGKVQFCDGNEWQDAGSGASTPCTIGAAVGDGICAGHFAGQNIIAARAGCTAGDATGADCDGTDDLAEWGRNGWADTDSSHIDSVQANADYFAYATANTLDVSTDAPALCAGITIDGKSWHLPTLPQLMIMFENRNTGAWTDGAFSSDRYFAINIADPNNADAVDFSFNGTPTNQNSNFASESFRCIYLD